MVISATLFVLFSYPFHTALPQQWEAYFLVVQTSGITKLTKDVERLPIAVNHTTACDYDFNSGYLFFSDLLGKHIKRANLDGTDVRTVVDTNIQYPDGLAVDWISKVIYWTDAELDVIDVIDYDGRNRIRLFDTGLDWPRAIVVSPVDGYMWWTDWGAAPRVERAWMDGTHREIIISTGLGWPNGLTVDYATRRIFWADAKLDKIETAFFDGSSRQLLIDNVPHPYAMSMYSDYIFWTDWDLGSVEMARKMNGQDRQYLATGFYRPLDLHYVTRYRQFGSNQCALTNGCCPSLCLMRPNNLGPVCKPEGFQSQCATTATPHTADTPPSGIVSPAVIRMDEGATETVQCKTTSTSSPKTELIWSGKKLGDVHNTFIPSNNGVTSISSLNLVASIDMNKENYTCKAIYKGHVIFSRETRIEVYYPPTAVEWYDMPTKLEVVENHTLTMKCEVKESYPKVATQWRRMVNDQTLTLESSTLTESAGQNGGTIIRMERTFAPNRAENGAHFWCEAKFQLSTGQLYVTVKSTQKQINVLYPLNVKLAVHTPIKEGQELTLTCETADGNPSTPDIYEWSLNGRILSGENARTLTRIPVLRNEGGVYSCRVRTRAGTSSDQRTVQVFYAPKVTVNVMPTSIKEGDHVTLTCSASGGQPEDMNSYLWTHNGMTLPNVHGDILILSPISRDQAGIYSCTATNQGGSDIDFKSIKVMYPPDVSVTSTKDNVQVGADVTLTCHVTGGIPTATEDLKRLWSHDGQILNGEFGKTLIISAIDHGGAGTYVCSVRTSGGSSTGQRVINVVDPPAVNIFIEPNVIQVGSKATMTCFLADSRLQTAFIWKHNDVILAGETGAKLVKFSVTKADSGEYECQAENAGGKESSRIIVNVLYKPEFDSEKKQTLELAANLNESASFTAYLLAYPPNILATECIKSGSASRIKVDVQKLTLIMTIEVVEMLDYGRHECRVKNEVGTFHFALELKQFDGTSGGSPGEQADPGTGTDVKIYVGVGVSVLIILIIVCGAVVYVLRRQRLASERLRESQMRVTATSDAMHCSFDNDGYIHDLSSVKRERPPAPLPRDQHQPLDSESLYVEIVPTGSSIRPIPDDYYELPRVPSLTPSDIANRD